ncbi:UbiX family flavin prenyltransferase [Terriglobus saanensis]|uniref:Flavin prenyltransferase UbiX n=1 Tax=Terriglobus saanensis (strain ATCC BAA-1853 / DSM 23119 / SP1PR4) TaxID=401053 RepID=E8V4V7_TERSS|nr:UbiX family flavin prenyltransferase [Terriglobus saanensis]ADV82585.1 3-octaprenyl-4-hydroxybenzoate carboxy-lyase [Terriglobus saanensis SP1PR4]
MTASRNLTLAITGASGAVYARAMLRLLAADERVSRVNLVFSDSALRVLAEELSCAGRSSVLISLMGTPSDKVHLVPNEDIGAGIASGSYPSDGMIVLPCSMGTLAGIAHGLAQKLIERAADVCLKERRPLILCVRETPFNLIHLRNMTLATEAGAVIYPAMPVLYTKPQSTEEMATEFCQRVLSHLGLRQTGAFVWKGDGSSEAL